MMIKVPLVFALLTASLTSLLGQGGPGPGGPGPGGPPPLQPLNPPPVPAGNPITAAKTNLGKVLFWDEQLSSTRTISCGTCHQPVSGGADPRSSIGAASSTQLGPDGILGTADDITGSPGVILNRADGSYELEDFFGMMVQVTGRYAPSAINAGYSPTLFWDGRADGSFEDPVTGQVVLANGAALESQAAGPPLSQAEMAHQNRDWLAVAHRIEGSKPLALSPEIPNELETWIASRNYPALFTEAFGDDAVTPSRIIMAIATYERTLVSNQAPIDAFIAGNQNALTAQERLGLQLFGQNQCTACHGGNRFTDDRFHYIGVRPQAEDQGRFLVTGNNADRGRMRTPSLRNASLRGEFMHNGRLASLEEVVEFYDRGGDFDAPNKDNDVRPLNLTNTEKEALIAFLGRPLTDLRVAAETGPFSRPALYADSESAPAAGTDSVDLESGQTPVVVVIEPPLAGNPNFTVGLTDVPSGQTATLVIDDSPIASGTGIPGAAEVKLRFDLTTLGETGEEGYLSQSFRIPGGSSFAGKTIYGKWFIADGPDTAESASFSATVFGSSAGFLPPSSEITASENESTSEVAVSWEEVSSADGYDVYRSSTSSFDDSSLVETTDATSFTDSEVSANQLYYYWVVAFHDNEASAPSAVAVGSTYDLTGFEFTASDFLSDTETVLSWTAHPAAAGYLVLRGDTSSPSLMTEIRSPGGVTTTSDTTGTAARTYFYRAVAVDGDGNEIATSEIDSGGKSLAAPADVTASVATYQDRIDLSWPSVAEATRYRIYRSSTDSAGTSIAVTTSSTWSDTTTIPGSPFYYEVAAENDYGSSERATRVRGSRAVSAPTGLTATVTGEPGQIILSWIVANGVSEYALFRSATNDFSSATEIATSSASSYLDETTEAGQSYYYWIASINGEDERIVEEAEVALGISGFVAPDLLVGKRADSLTGNSLYNTSGIGQTLTSRTRRYRKSTTCVSAQNDGNTEDVLRYTGGGGNRFFKVYCHRIAPTPTNLTAAAKVGVALSTDLEAGATESIQIKVKPVRSKQNRSRTYRLTTLLRAISTMEESEQDCIKVKTIAKY